MRRNGAAWALETSKPFASSPFAIAATSGGDLWFTTQDQGTNFFRLRGKQLSSASPLTGIYSAMAATGASTLIGVGQNGRIATSDGETWSQLAGTGGVYPTLTDVAIAGDTVVAAGPAQSGATAVAIRRATGAALYAEFPVGSTATGSASVWLAGTGANDGFLVAKDVYRSDGTSWKISSTLDASVTARMVRGRSASDVWVVGSRIPEAGGQVGWASRFDGSKWTDVIDPLAVPIEGLWVDPAGDVWIFGQGGIVARGGPAGFSPVATPSTSAQLRWISGSSGTDVWIAAQDVVYRWNESLSQWEAKTPPASTTGGPSQWVSVAARAADDVWVASQSGRAAHWDGQKWEPFEGLPPINAIGMNAAGSAWIVGQNGTVLRHDR